MLGLILVSLGGQRHPIASGDVLGRTAKCKEAMKDDLSVSRMHARFDFQEGYWRITDLGARNGTFIGERRLKPQETAILSDGLNIKLGTYHFTVQLETLPAPTPKDDSVHKADSAPKPAPASEASQTGEGQRKHLVVMFCRLRDSEDYFLREGTIAGRKWIFDFYNAFSSVVAVCNGTHLKNVNDVTLSVFEKPLDAARAALVLQGSLKRHNETAPPTDHYKLHVGISHGTVLYAHNDVYGNAVNIASRIQSTAPPGSIYVSEDFQGVLAAEGGLKFRFVDNVQLKGVKEKVGIYELLVEGPYAEDVQ